MVNLSDFHAQQRYHICILDFVAPILVLLLFFGVASSSLALVNFLKFEGRGQEVKARLEMLLMMSSKSMRL